MLLLDGKVVAQHLRDSLKTQTQSFINTNSRNPGLGVILIGNDPASRVYVQNKEKACNNIGFYSELIHLPENSSQQQVLEAVYKFNSDPKIDAFLVQLPLPSHLNKNEILLAIDSKKDADGLHPNNLGFLMTDQARVLPCTPNGVMKILNFYNISLAGKHCVVIGRSTIVGKPMAQLLTNANATVTLCHSYTQDLKKWTQLADVVIVAAGKAKFFDKSYFSPQSVVIDVGIHGSGQDKSLCGDVDFDSCSRIVKAITPVPGGVGPMTIACLLENTLSLAKKDF